MLLAQLSDTHILPPGVLFKTRVDTGALLAQAVATVLALPDRPDAALITGDLVDRGSDAEYDHLAKLIAPLEAAMPVMLIPGNHDDREALRRRFAHHSYLPPQGPLDFECRIGAVRLVARDSLVPGEPFGAIGAERLATLDTVLAAAPQTPTILALHHPPFASGLAHMDMMALLDGADLAAVVARHPQVERVICGHLHRALSVRFGGTIAECCPSTAHQLALDLSPAPGRAAAFTLEPPGIRLLHWRAGAGMVSHIVPTGLHPGPFLYSH